MVVAPSWVELDRLAADQGVNDKLVSDKIVAPTTSFCGGPFPHVLRRRDGSLFVSDGHHRVAAARRLGNRWLIARVVNE
jgi:hypothetical protein